MPRNRNDQLVLHAAPHAAGVEDRVEAVVGDLGGDAHGQRLDVVGSLHVDLQEGVLRARTAQINHAGDRRALRAAERDAAVEQIQYRAHRKVHRLEDRVIAVDRFEPEAEESAGYEPVAVKHLSVTGDHVETAGDQPGIVDVEHHAHTAAALACEDDGVAAGLGRACGRCRRPVHDVDPRAAGASAEVGAVGGDLRCELLRGLGHGAIADLQVDHVFEGLAAQRDAEGVAVGDSRAAVGAEVEDDIDVTRRIVGGARGLFQQTLPLERAQAEQIAAGAYGDGAVRLGARAGDAGGNLRGESGSKEGRHGGDCSDCGCHGAAGRADQGEGPDVAHSDIRPAIRVRRDDHGPVEGDGAGGGGAARYERCRDRRRGAAHDDQYAVVQNDDLAAMDQGGVPGGDGVGAQVGRNEREGRVAATCAQDRSGVGRVVGAIGQVDRPGFTLRHRAAERNFDARLADGADASIGAGLDNCKRGGGAEIARTLDRQLVVAGVVVRTRIKRIELDQAREFTRRRVHRIEIRRGYGHVECEHRTGPLHRAGQRDRPQGRGRRSGRQQRRHAQIDDDVRRCRRCRAGLRGRVGFGQHRGERAESSRSFPDQQGVV